MKKKNLNAEIDGENRTGECVSRYTASSQLAAEIFHSRGYHVGETRENSSRRVHPVYRASDVSRVSIRCPRSRPQPSRIHRIKS